MRKNEASEVLVRDPRVFSDGQKKGMWISMELDMGRELKGEGVVPMGIRQ